MIFANKFEHIGDMIGGEILSNFRYERSINQSKLLISNSNFGSIMSSQISSIKSICPSSERKNDKRELSRKNVIQSSKK